ncbi:Ca-activated chloride channel homolog [uncultured Gammaproteobacteria bacterium]
MTVLTCGNPSGVFAGKTGWCRLGIGIIAALVAVVGCFGADPAQAEPPVTAPPVLTKVWLDHPLITAGQATRVHVLIDLVAEKPAAGAAGQRPKVNLGLVLDRSGSMEEKGKIEYLRDAAKLAVDRLTATDRLAVVEYDDRITVLWPSQLVTAPDTIKALISRLTPRGSTNLTGGMMAGAEQVAAHVGPDSVTRVLLLTDGLANQGITSPAEIKTLVRQAKARGVRFSTIGLGLDYNEKLLQMIAEVGGGSYSYVENPKQMVRIFEQEVLALANTVARDCRLLFRPGSGGVSAKVTAPGLISRAEGETTIVDLEDFTAGESRSVLLRLELAAINGGKQTLGGLELQCQDARTRQPVNDRSDLTIEASADQKAIEQALVPRVAAEALIAEANETHAASLSQFEAGQGAAATQGLRDKAEEVERLNRKLKDPRLAAKLEALRLDADEMAKPVAAAPPAGQMPSQMYGRAASSAPAAPDAYALNMMKRSHQQIYQASRGKTDFLLLKPGDTGPRVAELQEALKKAGLYSGPIDATYSETVAKAVREYQKRESMPEDGMAGPATMQKLGLY